jgi:E3 ubiquitin-protein ligase UBR2
METDSTSILCLICGEMLTRESIATRQEIGSQRVGNCTAHAYKCGKTSGMFLRINECQVLLLHLNKGAGNEIHVRGSFVPAPYIDNYGETDQGLRRGDPLHLCLNRYKKLHQMWLSHAIPDQVSRSYQNNQSSLINVEWISL